MLALAARAKVPKHQKTFQQLYQFIDGYAVSGKERALPTPEYVYGEIEFESFLALVG